MSRPIVSERQTIKRRIPVVRIDANGEQIRRHYVISTAIAAIIYDVSTENCWVTFHRGGTFQLSGFPEIELERWLESDSIGQYWNSNLIGRY